MSFTAKVMDDDDVKQINKWFPHYQYKIEYNPGKFIMSEKYGEILQDILDFEVRENDVWVSSYVNSGGNWLQEIVWLIVNNLDFETAKRVDQMKRAPVIGITGLTTQVLDGNSVDYARNMKSPRCIKTHEPYGLLPKQMETLKPKLIYLIRNPKDVFCSAHTFLTVFVGMKATLEECAEFYCQGKMPYGSHINHCLEYWKRRHESNILILTYEELLADTKKGIRNIAKFLDRPLTEDQIDIISDSVKFDSTDFLVGRVEPASGFGQFLDVYIRESKCGDWKTKLSPRVSKIFDEWVERETEGSDFAFSYEIN